MCSNCLCSLCLQSDAQGSLEFALFGSSPRFAARQAVFESVSKRGNPKVRVLAR